MRDWINFRDRESKERMNFRDRRRIKDRKRGRIREKESLGEF